MFRLPVAAYIISEFYTICSGISVAFWEHYVARIIKFEHNLLICINKMLVYQTVDRKCPLLRVPDTLCTKILVQIYLS